MDVTELDVQCRSCGSIVNLNNPKGSKKYARIFGGLSAIFFGFGVGASIGIATAGVGIPAILPLFIIGGYAGVKVGRWWAKKRDGYRCPECSEDHSN